MLEYSKLMEELPDFDVFSNKYNESLEKQQPEFIKMVNEGMTKEKALVKLGDAIWDDLYSLYGVKATFIER